MNPTSGLVTAVAAGSTNITYTVNTGCNSPVSAFQALTVTVCGVTNDDAPGAITITVGAGCSGFQLLHHLSLQPDWLLKKVALFSDGVPLQRSWCFWSKEQHPLQHLVKKSWSKVTFKGKDFSKTEDVSPYQYHYIPGETFFDYFQHDFLSQHQNIALFNGNITGVQKNNTGYYIQSSNEKWKSQTVLSSLPPVSENIQAQFWLNQHFKGWFIKTEQPVFDDSTLTLMDFSIPQRDDTRFIYILPFSNHEALVEMTVFSPTMYPPPHIHALCLISHA